MYTHARVRCQRLLTPLGGGATIACSLLLKACQLVSDWLAGASAGSGSKSHKILPAEGAVYRGVAHCRTRSVRFSGLAASAQYNTTWRAAGRGGCIEPMGLQAAVWHAGSWSVPPSPMHAVVAAGRQPLTPIWAPHAHRMVSLAAFHSGGVRGGTAKEVGGSKGCCYWLQDRRGPVPGGYKGSGRPLPES